MSLTLNPYLMLLVFVVFMALIILLNSWLYRPILAFMEKRNQMLFNDLETLQNEKQEIQRVHQELKNVLELAREEAKAIKEKATLEAQEKYNESFKRAKSEIEARFLESKKLLDAEKNAIREEMQKNYPLFQKEIEQKISNIEG